MNVTTEGSIDILREVLRSVLPEVVPGLQHAVSPVELNEIVNEVTVGLAQKLVENRAKVTSPASYITRAHYPHPGETAACYVGSLTSQYLYFVRVIDENGEVLAQKTRFTYRKNRPSTFARAIVWFLGHPGQPVQTDELAEILGISVRQTRDLIAQIILYDDLPITTTPGPNGMREHTFMVDVVHSL